MKKYLVLISYCTLIFVAVFVLYKKVALQPVESQQFYISHNSQAVAESDFFIEAVSYWPKGSVESNSTIRGGVVPHHLLASPMIAHFFSTVSSQKVETIVIFAPDHEEVGVCRVVTTEEYRSLLEDLEFVCASDSVIANEHAVSLVKSFAEYYLPGVSVMPIVLSNFTTLEEIEKLTATVYAQTSESQTVYVGSVDFSHYLPESEADEKDAETLELLKNKEYEKLLLLDQENLDSPESVVSVMKIMDLIGHTNFTVQAHENSSATSYYEIIW